MNTPLTPKEKSAPQTLEEWSRWLQEKEMPIFSKTVSGLNLAIEDQKAGTGEVSRIILEDPSLTAKLLKLGNCPIYNPTRQQLATVTRAIVLLGLDAIRELAIACSFIESIISQRNKDKVNLEIARALNAAVQAKSLAVLVNDRSPEEVFIAALLHNIGRIAFWCFEQSQGEEIERVIATTGLDAEKAERQVLGFRLDQLGAALSKSWNLGGLIAESFVPQNPSPRTEYVKLACEIAKTSERGWDTPEMKGCLVKLEKLTGKTPAEAKALIKLNTESAIDLATRIGAGKAAKFMPGADKSVPASRLESDEPVVEKTEVTLLQIIQDISNLMLGEINLNLLFEMVLEGTYRALRMDRVLFALVSPDRKLIREKFALGWPPQETRGLLQIPLSAWPRNLFSYAMEHNESLWARKDDGGIYSELYTPTIQSHIGSHECLIAPVSLEQKVIGFFYTDRAFCHKPMSQADFEGFRHITQQANIALRLSRAGH